LKRLVFGLWVLFALAGSQLWAAGTLTAVGSDSEAIRIQAHDVQVTLNNGFAMTQVTQTYFNPNSVALEAVYTCPIPRSASLSEYEVHLGEVVMQGEVLSKKKAEELYGKAKEEGEDTGLASKEAFDTFRFAVSPVPPQAEVTVRYVYYQPIEIDTGVGRYVYPLAEGGTDEASQSFWSRREKVEQAFTFSLELKSGWPVDEVRMPGFENQAVTTRLDTGYYRVELKDEDFSLSKDLVFYYRLEENLPGRIDLLTHKVPGASEGTFMMICTPGVDLKPLQNGADYLFVLDISGSMADKMGAMIEGVERAIGTLSGSDRFAIVLFDDHAENLTKGWIPATPAGVKKGLDMVAKLGPRGGTNLHAGLNMALGDLEKDRTTTLILVTDAVTNRGEVDPRAFYNLLQNYDIRFFGYLLGNNANWPLMSVLTEASGGTYARVSGSDDMVGQVMLAKSKVTSQAMHHAAMSISGVSTSKLVGEMLAKIFRGQQWVIFGRYKDSGNALLELKTRISGVDKTYTTEVLFPDVAMDHPELERLWALAQIEEHIVAQQCGFIDAKELEQEVTKLGIDYQLVTDYTSMLVLQDHKFEEYGIDRANRERIASERLAQNSRATQGPVSNRADNNAPIFRDSAPTLGNGGGGGGGALSPWMALLLLGIPLALSWRKP